ncbi:MAG: hypothetical protein P1P89_07070 [Desulfobacterales bacterium]|nr:hypothetical protein [Desulfobacterales bacterium]
MKKEKTKISPDRAAARSGAWLKLLVGIGVVLLFMFVAGPVFQRLPGFVNMAAFIEKEGIRATAIYYTDVKEFGEAEVSLRNNFAFFIANSQGHGPKPKVDVPPAFSPN